MIANQIETLKHRGIEFLVGFNDLGNRSWWVGEPIPEMELLVSDINYVVKGRMLMWADSASWPCPSSPASRKSVIADMKRDIDTILDGGLLKPLQEKIQEAKELAKQFAKLKV